MINRPEPEYNLFPCVTPGWDNSPRRNRYAEIFIDSTPEAYKQWLKSAIQFSFKRFANPSEQLVFINAWNEWGEGNHLEPDLKWGRAYLESTKSAIASFIEV
jgi:lipopolysaccharide biosynthesis protein